MRFKLRACSRRLPSNALPQHPRVNTDRCLWPRVSPGQRGEPREPGLRSGQSLLLPTGTVLAPGKGQEAKLCLHGISQHQQSPTGVQARLSPSKSSGSCYGEMRVPPGAAAGGRKEGLASSPAAEPASPGWSRHRALELRCSGPRSGCGGSCPVQAQGPSRPHSSGRWTPLSNDRTLRAHCKHCETGGLCKNSELESAPASPSCRTPCPWTQQRPMGLRTAAGIRCTSSS